MHTPVLIFLTLLGSIEGHSESSKVHPESQTQKPPPNVILLIGDGMGTTQLSSALFYGENKPAFLQMPVVGLVQTSSSSDKITDSAAGATAMSCGEKTYNGAIGVDADTNARPTLLELLAQKGRKTGLVATSSITHATPASFYAHIDSRDKEYAIAKQLVHAPVHFFAGGGQKFFYQRPDGSSLAEAFSQNNIKIDTQALRAPAEGNTEQRYGYLLADEGMPPILKGRGDFLPKATDMALNYLSQGDKPFFLMVEGSQIDWGGHANDGAYLTTEMLDFDKAIARALAFARKQDNTLVIVTADHECGGYTLAGTNKKDPQTGESYRDYDDLRHGFSTHGHSAAMVPLLAYGPGAERFTGIYQNTAIFDKLVAISQLKR